MRIIWTVALRAAAREADGIWKNDELIKKIGRISFVRFAREKGVSYLLLLLVTGDGGGYFLSRGKNEFITPVCRRSEGYLSVSKRLCTFPIQIDSLSICYKHKPASEVPIRVEVSIVNGFDIVRWSGENGYSSSSSSSIFTPELQEKPVAVPFEGDATVAGEGEEKVPEAGREEVDTTETYLVGFNSMRFKSNFLELNSTTMNTVANATLLLKVVEVKDNGGAVAAAGIPAAKAAAPAAAKGKGKEAEAPAEIKEPSALIEMRLPLSNLLGMSTIDVQEYLADLLSEFSMVSTTLGSELIVAERSTFSWRVSLNHDLAAYTFGSRIVSWSSAKIHLPPAAWAVKSPDVSDPKAKVPPTAEEFRARYLENIPKLLAGQQKIVSFSLCVGLHKSDGFARSAAGLNVVAEGDGEGDEESKADATDTQGGLKLGDFFPGVYLEGGAIAFDAEKAAEVGIDEDIRRCVCIHVLTVMRENEIVFPPFHFFAPKVHK